MSRHNRHREAQTMTHEPEGIRRMAEAASALIGVTSGYVPTPIQQQRVLAAIEEQRALLRAAAVTGWSFESVESFVSRDARNRQVSRIQAAHQLEWRAVHGYDLPNPEPTVRFTYDGTQSDPGDEHTPR